MNDLFVVPLTQGYFAIVDAEDAPLVANKKWCVSKERGRTYAVRRNQRMHRVITGAPREMDVDHANHNTLDNRSANLRVCTRAENLWNTKPHATNATGYIGVQPSRERYLAWISIKRKKVHIGVYDTAKEAAIARDKASLEIRGDFAYLNFPELREGLGG